MICPRCKREAVGWPLRRADVCSPKEWVSCLREPEAIIKKAAKVLVVALFSLAFIAGCTYTHTSERCPAPLSAKGCYAHVQERR